MNRVQLVQVIVIIAAVILGYQMIFCFAYFISDAVSALVNNGRLPNAYTLSYGLLALLFAISLFIILNNAPKISLWIIDKVQPDEEIDLSFSDKNVIYAVLLFLTLGSLLKDIPFILYQLFELFKRNAGVSSSSHDISDSFVPVNYPQMIEAVVAFILLIKAKAVVDYFHSKIDPNDPHAIREEATPTEPENQP